MRIAVTVSYFNRPDLLSLCLESLSLQRRKPDQLIILDDGSEFDLSLNAIFYETGVFNDDDLKKLDFLKPGCAIEVSRLSAPVVTSHGILHEVDLYLRQPHNGFGKELLLNKALLETDCDYLVSLDQDCVVPPEWLEIHERIARRCQYVCGMYTSLNEEQSRSVTTKRIRNGWIWEYFKDAYPSRPHIWCGAGSAAWIEDALKINGFDTRFGVTGCDYNFGLRLAKIGLSWEHFCPHGRYFHLWHEKPWAADKSDYKSGDKYTANEYARKWAEEEPITRHGIAEQDMSKITLTRGGRYGTS
jgi:GT2 family glycosyltransferase